MDGWIALIGLPGSGKSSVGAVLARRLRLPFVDTDVLIEEHIGCSIREYFDSAGESAFRDVEALIIQKVSAGGAAVVATGGGAILRESNRALLRNRGCVVYLCLLPEEVAHRLQRDIKRPLLRVDDRHAKLQQLYLTRHPLYQQTAHLEVTVGNRSIHRAADMVLAQLGSATSGEAWP